MKNGTRIIKIREEAFKLIKDIQNNLKDTEDKKYSYSRIIKAMLEIVELNKLKNKLE